MRIFRTATIVLLAIASFAQRPATPAPTVIRFSGAVTGTHAVRATFSLYDSQYGGALLWQEMQQITPDASGRYSVLLGSATPNGLPVGVFSSGEARWLGVTLPNGAEGARIMLVSVPYAITAFDAATLGGHTPDEFVTRAELAAATSRPKVHAAIFAQAQSAITPVPEASSGTQNFIGKFNATGVDLGNSQLFDNGASIGLGTTTPDLAAQGNRTLTIFHPTQAAAMEFGSGTTSSSAQVGVFAFVATGSTATAANKRIAFFDSTLDTSNASYGGRLRFGTKTPGGSLATRMTITSAGKVGIGTLTPSQLLDVNGAINASGAVSAASFTGSGSGLTSIPAANISGSVPTTGIPDDVRTRVITYIAGCDSCGALATSDAQNRIFINQYTSLSILSVACYTDAGAPVINVRRDNAGSLSNVLASDLTCSSTGASSASAASLVAGDKLDFTITSVDNTAKRATIVIKAKVN